MLDPNAGVKPSTGASKEARCITVRGSGNLRRFFRRMLCCDHGYNAELYSEAQKVSTESQLAFVVRPRTPATSRFRKNSLALVIKKHLLRYAPLDLQRVVVSNSLSCSDLKDDPEVSQNLPTKTMSSSTASHTQILRSFILHHLILHSLVLQFLILRSFMLL